SNERKGRLTDGSRGDTLRFGTFCVQKLKIERDDAMVRPLSERLEEISARARRAEEHVRWAREEGDEKLRARLSELKADAEARASQIEGDVSSTWAELRAKVRSQIDEIKADLDGRKYERDAKHAAKRADKV